MSNQQQWWDIMKKVPAWVSGAISFLNCETRVDRIQSESGSYLTAGTELGPLKLHILKVKRVDFQW